MSTRHAEDQFDTALLLSMREDLQALHARTDARFSTLEQAVSVQADAIRDLSGEIKKLVVLRSASSPNADAGEQAPAVASPGASMADGDDVSSHWNYIIAKKGGYNNILYTTTQELLELGEDGIAFLEFLAHKRDIEVRDRLEQLQAEYQRLQGNQLQEHFQELWKSHYLLLKSKQSRTWKEDIFLAAFDAFIAWIQT